MVAQAHENVSGEPGRRRSLMLTLLASCRYGVSLLSVAMTTQGASSDKHRPIHPGPRTSFPFSDGVPRWWRSEIGVCGEKFTDGCDPRRRVPVPYLFFR
jgi:hypothetical protein